MSEPKFCWTDGSTDNSDVKGHVFFENCAPLSSKVLKEFSRKFENILIISFVHQILIMASKNKQVQNDAHKTMHIYTKKSSAG